MPPAHRPSMRQEDNRALAYRYCLMHAVAIGAVALVKVESNEALAVFVRFWLSSTPPLPDAALAAAQTKGRERYDGFVEALGRWLARGRRLADEVSLDIDGVAPENDGEPR